MAKKVKNDPIKDLGIGQIHYVEKWLKGLYIPFVRDNIDLYKNDDGTLSYIVIKLDPKILPVEIPARKIRIKIKF